MKDSHPQIQKHKIYRKSARSKRREERMKSRERSKNIAEKYDNIFIPTDICCAMWPYIDSMYFMYPEAVRCRECVEIGKRFYQAYLSREEKLKEDGIREEKERIFQEMSMYVKG